VTISHLILASSTPVNFFKGWKLSGNFTTVDLIAASTNALNGALLARRDVMLNKVPGALTNPAYITVAVVFGVVGYRLAFAEGQLFREGLFQFMTSFSLAWYAIAGAQAGVDAKLPLLGTLLMALVGPTAGRWYIDVSSGVTPKQFIRGEWFIGTALLTGLIWAVFYWRSSSTAAAASRGQRGSRLHRVCGADARPVPRLGGATGQRAQRCLQTRRRPPAARPQARRQIPTRTA